MALQYYMLAADAGGGSVELKGRLFRELLVESKDYGACLLPCSGGVRHRSPMRDCARLVAAARWQQAVACRGRRCCGSGCARPAQLAADRADAYKCLMHA